MSKKNFILRNSLGEFRIEALSLGVRHSEMVQVAPHGFGPGDEKYIKQGNDGKLIFDYDRKFKDARRGNDGAREQVKKERWNKLSVMERIKLNFKA